MAKPSPSTIKAFCVASTLGAVLKSNQDGHPKLLQLQLQINRAMKVFYRKASPKVYWSISNKVAEVWETIAERHQNSIKAEEVPKFIEYLCILVPPQDFKAFLATTPFRTSVIIDSQTNINIIESILLLDEEINKICGTKSYTMSVRKPKPIKVKKIRDKSKKTISNTGSNLTKNQLKERQRHTKAKSFLQECIKQSKQSKDNS